MLNYRVLIEKLLKISQNIYLSQNYYIFQPISKYLKLAYVNDINYILSWKSRGLNNIKIESIKTNSYLLNPCMDHYDMNKIRIKFNGSF